uniref:Uncharacterized protein n=1 Tax=Kalanchoe fedtschenkoi TaxID=63787 RepID=A0A7N0RD83_KALFE
MGRRPCCAKEGLNKGAWTAEEDRMLAEYMEAYGEGKWPNVPNVTGLKRCGKSCRLRWLNYLRPDIKRGNISPDEEDLIVRLHNLLGNRWSLIAGRLPGRTDNEVKNYWNTYLSKKIGSSNKNNTKKKQQQPPFHVAQQTSMNHQVLLEEEKSSLVVTASEDQLKNSNYMLNTNCSQKVGSGSNEDCLTLEEIIEFAEFGGGKTQQNNIVGADPGSSSTVQHDSFCPLGPESNLAWPGHKDGQWDDWLLDAMAADAEDWLPDCDVRDFLNSVETDSTV